MTKPDIELLAEGEHLRFLKWGAWEYVERTKSKSAVVIVAVTDAGGLLFVEQFRPPISANCIELPAGLVGDVRGEKHDAYAKAGRRELIEETGYNAASITYLTEGFPSPGQSNEHVVLLLAEGLTRVSNGGGVVDERITVHEVPLAEAEEWLFRRMKGGTSVDPKAYLGIYFAARHWGKRSA